MSWTLRGEAAPVNSGIAAVGAPVPVGRTTEVRPEGPVGYGAPPVVVAGAGAGVTPG